MDRYLNTKILRNSSGERYKGTTLYPQITPKDTDIYVTTVYGDRLDILAGQYYKDVSLYFVLLAANNIKSDSLYPPVGTQLRIPTDISGFLNDFKQINKR